MWSLNIYAYACIYEYLDFYVYVYLVFIWIHDCFYLYLNVYICVFAFVQFCVWWYVFMEYMFMSVCVHHMHICVIMHVYCEHLYICLYKYIFDDIHALDYMCVHVCLCVYVFAHVCVYVYVWHWKERNLQVLLQSSYSSIKTNCSIKTITHIYNTLW